MATGDDQSSHESTHSNDDGDFYCTPCSQEYRTIEAEKYCQNCIQNLCSNCLQQHEKFDGMKSHILTKRKDTRTIHLEHLRYMCDVHTDKPLVTYCKQCDKLCCAICGALSHRGCPNVNYFPRKVKQMSSSAEFHETFESLHQVKEQLESLEKARQLDVEKVDLCATNITQKIQNYREKINAILDKMEAKVHNETELKHSKLKERINRDIRKIAKMLKLVKDEITKMNDNSNDDVRTYIHIKQAQGELRTVENFIKDMKTTVGKEQLSFKINERIHDSLSDIATSDQFGYFSRRHTIHKEMQIKDITGGIIMDDYIVMVTKGPNSSITKLDKHLNILDTLTLDQFDDPSNLCAVSKTEVAMTIPMQKRIQFISVEKKLVKTKHIDLDQRPDGIGLIQDELYIICDSRFLLNKKKVLVYDLIRNSHHTLNTQDADENLFTCPRSILTDKECGLIYITDQRKGIVILDQDGNHLTTVSHPDLKSPNKMCTGASGSVYVAGNRSIFELSPNGEDLSILLDKKYDIKHPTAIWFDHDNSRLYVAMESDRIKILDIN